MKRLYAAAIAVGGIMSICGCANHPTPTSQITGTYVSPVKYEKFDCEQLVAENNSLARRENQLVIAQEQRLKTSKVQAFWYGYGNGDGIEASELANVRGDKEAVLHAMEKNSAKRHRKIVPEISYISQSKPPA